MPVQYKAGLRQLLYAQKKKAAEANALVLAAGPAETEATTD